MKYMGSKRWMLGNGLGDLIVREVKRANTFRDLFSGSGAVSIHVATKYNIPVVAYDLQTFSAVLNKSVLERQSNVDGARLWKAWVARATNFRELYHPPDTSQVTQAVVNEQRLWSSRQTLQLTKAYGGHYFSAQQAIWLDALRQTLPEAEPNRTIALAALIRSASQCGAAPGHTAQPFQPTRTAKPFLRDAWQRGVTDYCKKAVLVVSSQCAKVRGQALVEDANSAATRLSEGDLAFIDPPYSGVHYSRFYHVLKPSREETVVTSRALEDTLLRKSVHDLDTAYHQSPLVLSKSFSQRSP